MTDTIELYCKNGHDITKVMISGIGRPLTRLAVNAMDMTEIKFICRNCKKVFNTIEIRGGQSVWNGKTEVTKETRFDNEGNIIK